MRLSRRLQAAADMVTVGNVAADIGCDHGYLSIYLAENGICPKIIAMDVNKGPMEKAKTHVRRFGLEAYIETRLSDGTKCLREGEADTLLCAGMGGRLTVQILEEGRRKTALMKELILQPQSEIFLVRRYLRENGFLITEETMIFEDGKYYPVMRAVCSKESPDITGNMMLWDTYGEKLLRNRNPILLEFLRLKQLKQQNLLKNLKDNQIKTKHQIQRAEELEAELKLIEEALEVMTV